MTPKISTLSLPTVASSGGPAITWMVGVAYAMASALAGDDALATTIVQWNECPAPGTTTHNSDTCGTAKEQLAGTYVTNAGTTVVYDTLTTL